MIKKSTIVTGAMPIARHRPAGSFAMLFFGPVFAVIRGCVFWFLGSDITLTCQRSTDTCILEKASMLGRKEVVASLPLRRVKSAEVESRKGGKISGGSSRAKPTYQVVLRTDDGTIPFSNVWTGEQKAHKQNASDINTYLASSEESLVIVQSGKTIRLIGGLFFAVGGLAFLRGLWGVLRMFRDLKLALSARS